MSPLALGAPSDVADAVFASCRSQNALDFLLTVEHAFRERRCPSVTIKLAVERARPHAARGSVTRTRVGGRCSGRSAAVRLITQPAPFDPPLDLGPYCAGNAT